MRKLIQYLKPFWISIIMVVALLFGQAYCELTLPDYMQNIVNQGIQNQGIEDGVYQQMRQSTFESLYGIATSEQQEVLEDSYTLLTSNKATSEEIEEIPALKTENIYVLNDIDETMYESLESDLMELEMISLSILEDAKEPSQIPVMLMQNGIETYRERAQKQIKSLGQTTVTSACAQIVKNEYQKLGMNIENIQQSYIKRSGFIMLGYALCSAICAILVGLLSARIASGFAKNMRQDVFEKVTYFSNENFHSLNTSTLITRTTNDIQQIQMATVMVLRIVVYAPIMGIGALIHVMNSEANMTWIIALCVIMILSIVMSLFMIVMPKFKVMQKLLDKMNSIVREILDGMLVIRAFNNQSIEAEKFEHANHDITRISIFTTRAMMLMMPLMTFLLNGTTLLILWFGAKQVDTGAIQVGSIMAFMQYAMQVIMSFLMITMVSIMIPRANVSLQRVVEILDTDSAIIDPTSPQHIDATQRAHVKFNHVSFAYPGADENVLEDINFETRPGQVTALIGSTGSGKSTLINLVPRFYDVSEGSIEIDGQDVRNLSQKDLRDRIGYVPQKGILLSGTIESNLKYANPQASVEDIQEALTISQSKEFVDQKPLGINESIAQGGTNVSGGQRQRLSIARAIVRQPEIYIFDDSFSALDYKTDAALREALLRSCKKTQSTVLLVAQRISTILHADQIIVLDEGKMVGKGTHEELMKTCKVYQEIASSQLSKEELANA